MDHCLTYFNKCSSNKCNIVVTHNFSTASLIDNTYVYVYNIIIEPIKLILRNSLAVIFLVSVQVKKIYIHFKCEVFIYNSFNAKKIAYVGYLIIKNKMYHIQTVN